MEKFFNTAGPCFPEDHYMIDPRERFTHVRELIEQKKYFIVHAPRQTGKTTNMIALAKELNEEGHYIALYLDVEAGQALRNNVEDVNLLIMSVFEKQAQIYLSKEYRPEEVCFQARSMQQGLSYFLTQWCLQLPKPLVVFMDEVDSLIGDSLISVLRQLREGYSNRPKAFPHSLCIIGLKDICDYRIFSDSSKRYIIGGSAFNIKDESVRIADFTLNQVQTLYNQHTEATGQNFAEGAIQKVFELTYGQPWLVNALGRELCFGRHKIPDGRTITPENVENAAEILILRRDVHLDQLADKLTEERVARVIQPILLGESIETGEAVINEDQQYLIDLGLIRQGKNGLEIANPIYREVIPRELTLYQQNTFGQDPAWYVKDDGCLDINKVLEQFIEFFKENGEIITNRKTYTEAAYHLTFMAWLQRIVNGAGPAHRGTLSREYAAGLKRLDLYIQFADNEGRPERFAFELKRSHKNVLAEGLEQLSQYLDRLSLTSGWLMVFSRGPVDDWGQIGHRETKEHRGKSIEVIWL